jgi:hypothetical protein
MTLLITRRSNKTNDGARKTTKRKTEEKSQNTTKQRSQQINQTLKINKQYD